MSLHEGSLELSPETPQRLSALYQYHNAPEVAPAHGLEYDDSNYPHSDKYPVIHSTPAYNSTWTSKGFTDENRPPRIIFGMKVRTFLVVATIMVMVLVGAAVGGAVGGSTIKAEGSTWTPTSTNVATSNTTANTSSTQTAMPSLYSAPLPTYAPLADCPAANNTLYTSPYNSAQTTSNLNFTRYCDVENPLSSSNTMLSTFVYSFEDCIDACAGLNYYNSNNNGNCQVAAFQANGTRPANCWIGSDNTVFTNLKSRTGMAVALLHP